MLPVLYGRARVGGLAKAGAARPAPVAPRLPRWARAADVTAIALVGAGLLVAASGGFHARVAGWRVGVTSSARLIAWGIVVFAVRSALARETTAAAHVASWARTWARADAVRSSLMVVAATRPIVLLVGYLAVALFGYAPNARPFHEFDSDVLNLPLRWDAGWYLQIAASGYEFLRHAGPDLQQNVVFFPAYPMAVRFVALLFGNAMGAYVAAGVAVSLLFFAIALAYVHALAAAELNDERAVTVLWLLAAYPFAIFYGAIYSESLYLAAAAGSFYHWRRGEYGRVALWGLVAGLARPNGFLLCVPLAIELRRKIERRAIGAALAPIAGVAIYSLLVWQLTGSPLTWLTGHEAWGRHYQGFSALVVDRYDFIAHAGFAAYASQRPYDLLNAIGVLFVLASTWPVARRFGAAYAAFILVNILPPLSTGGLMSAGRFSSVLFPAFFWLAAIVPARQAGGWIAAFAALQALDAALFYTWRPLY